jgi:anaerobic magnesium-protoporphyrin IX monomethyl ester cyclase
MKMKKILLMNLPSTIAVYSKSALKGVMSAMPPLTLVELGAASLAAGAPCRILDLQGTLDPFAALHDCLENFKPEVVGISSTSLLYHEAQKVAACIKDHYPEILLVIGGPHASIFQGDLVAAGPFDIAVQGEGDLTLREILEDRPLEEIAGIAFKTEDGRVVMNPKRSLLSNLDALPLPAWHLVNPNSYVAPKFLARESPAGAIMTSRGCPYGCTYCCHATFGRSYRAKSVERVVREFQHLASHGFREILIWDDMFAMDLNRAKGICDALIASHFTVPWQIETGLRVNHVDRELFQKLRRAGCYKTAFGFESGSNEVLKSLNKNTTVEQARNAVRWAKEAGLETVGFFMLGLLQDNLATLDATLEFSQSLDLDYAKTTIFVPFPATRDFEELDRQGLITTKDWTRYNFHTASRVFVHPSLDWDTLQAYYHKFYKDFYFRPRYLMKRMIRSLKGKRLFDDLRVGFASLCK